jgi:hypothetical protein
MSFDLPPSRLDCFGSLSSALDSSSMDEDGMFEKSPLDFSPSSPLSDCDPPKFVPTRDVYSLWRESRMCGTYGEPLVSGGQRPFTRANLNLAGDLLKACAADLIKLVWGMHPGRTTSMMLLNVVRGLFPAFKGYSQALIVNEVNQHFSLGINHKSSQSSSSATDPAENFRCSFKPCYHQINSQ